MVLLDLSEEEIWMVFEAIQELSCNNDPTREDFTEIEEKYTELYYKIQSQVEGNLEIATDAAVEKLKPVPRHLSLESLD